MPLNIEIVPVSKKLRAIRISSDVAIKFIIVDA